MKLFGLPGGSAGRGHDPVVFHGIRHVGQEVALQFVRRRAVVADLSFEGPATG